ncbi:MAG: hypothetical protein KDA84_24145, partial [Planctomycetaceae bacterium]|nr:hypothetical protein [Planctomycetaceae bacterium]
MRSFCHVTALVLCGMVVGCGLSPQSESQSVEETIPPTRHAEATQRAENPASELPPAPMPDHELNAKDFLNKPASKF